MTTLLVDGNNLAMTAIYGMRRAGLKAKETETGPLLAAVQRLARYVRDVGPTRLLVAWDGGRSVRRLQLDSAYKANRQRDPDCRERDTFELLESFFVLAGVPTFRLRGEEADDIIAGAWAHLSGSQEEKKIVLLSSDKDMLQLLGSNPYGVLTEQIRFNSANSHSVTASDTWDEARLLSEKGIRPEHLPLLMALSGDSIDGVRGVPGVGPVKGLKLLQTHDFDLARVADTVRRTHGDEEADRLPVDFELVNLRQSRLAVAVPEWRPVTPEDREMNDPRAPVLEQFLEYYELARIHEEWESGALWRPRVTIPGRVWGKHAAN